MTDSSSLANALSEPLRQPFWWAALASVGLHGVFGVSAPTLSKLIYGNSSKNVPGSVGVVELTPAEASRLPQTIPPRRSNTPFSIAPVPIPPSPNLTQPLPPAPGDLNLPAQPLGMPPPGFFSPLPPEPLPPRDGASPPPPPRNPSQNLQAAPLKAPIPTLIPPALPGGIPIFPPPLTGNFDRNIPPPPSPPENGLPLFPPGGLEQDEGQTLQERIAKSRIPGLSNPNDISAPDYPGYRNPEAKQVPKLTQKDPNKRNLIAETPEEKIKRQQFEAGQQQLGGPRQTGSSLSGNRETQLAAANTYFAMFKEFQTAYPDLATTGPRPVDVPYPAAACSQKLEGVAVFGAIVNPQGSIQAKPQTILPTGYSILDNAAKDAINSSLRFPVASTHKLYPLAVAFKYDEKVCGGIPATPSATPTSPRPAAGPTAPTPTQPASPAPAEVKPLEKPPAASDKPKPGATPPPTPQPKPAAEQPAPTPQPKPAAEQPPATDIAPKPAAEQPPAPDVAPKPAAEQPPATDIAPKPATEQPPATDIAPKPAAEQPPATDVAPN